MPTKPQPPPPPLVLPVEPGESKVTFEFARSADYRVVAANGAWGGVTPQGDFFLDFFVDHWRIPDEISNLIDTNGLLGREVERKPSAALVATRTRQVGVVLTLDQAENLARFIQTRIDALKGAREALESVVQESKS